MKLLLQKIPDSQLYGLHEALCSMLEARNRGFNPGRQVELPDEAFQLQRAHTSAVAIAVACIRWGAGVKLIEQKKKRRRKKVAKKTTKKIVKKRKA